LTYAALGNDDNGEQKANVLLGLGKDESYIAAKQFLNNQPDVFINDQGKAQRVFTVQGNEFYEPLKYSQYNADATYRDFMWNSVGINYAPPANASAQDKSLYEQRETERLARDAKSLVTGMIPGVMAIGAGTVLNRSPAVRSATNSESPSGQPPSHLSENLRVNPDFLQPEADFAGRGLVRQDLANHLVNASRSGRQISGGHEIGNFTIALNEAGGKVLSRNEKALGIYEIEYQMPGASKSATKTVYDPVVYPNMTELVNVAANKALMQYQQTADLSISVVVEGIKFTVPIRVQNGVPTVPTVIPTGVVK